MSMHVVDPSKLSELRQHAESRLQEGEAPKTLGWSSSAQALSLLHRLASDPASAADALKLLHELQVHQVELDLQHEQMEQQLLELSGALSRAERRGDALQAVVDGRRAATGPASAPQG
jgi:hypothetical protein